MIITGVDPHPDSHTAAALDRNAKVSDHLRLEDTPEGHERLVDSSERLGAERRWAVEGAGNPFAAPLVADLLSRGGSVVDIPPGLTSQYRSKRGAKKNHEVDAANAARASLANPGLPPPTLLGLISGVCR